ncbi:MAG: 3-isopropylmalate dehydrogenase [Anaerolineales bacterium]
MNATIVLLPGDGVGPEVVAAARTVLEAVAAEYGHDFAFDEHLIGGCSIDAHGVALTPETLAACRQADAVLLGAVGGPQWDDPTASVRPEQGLLGLRKGLGFFANLRPVHPHPQLLDASPLKPERLAGVDVLVVRELTGGIYFGEPRARATAPDGSIRAVDTMAYCDYEIERVVDLACRLATGRRGKVTSVDKANVLESSRLWRQVATDVAARHPKIEFDHQLVDAAAMRLVTQPAAFDVLVTGNMFGDILTDEASVLTGSMGNLPSASLGDSAAGLYEPIHGSAPDIAGQGIANPIGAILSAAMLLRYSLNLEAEATAIEAAVDRALADGCRTVDLSSANPLSTNAMTAAIVERLG